jgi:hypothetical protein
VHHGERDGERPVVHLGVEDVLVVDDDGEGEEDPQRHVHVRDQHLAEHRLRHAAHLAAAARRLLRHGRFAFVPVVREGGGGDLELELELGVWEARRSD